MEIVIQDIRYALRRLLKAPGFTLVAAVTLALGVAGATAIFSVIDQVLLQPLPYRDSGRIVVMSQSQRSTGELMFDASPANYLDWAAQNRVFSVMAAERGGQGNLGDDRPERVRLAQVSVGFFPLFGIAPTLGRTLNASDEGSGDDHVAVIGNELWKRRFGGDPALVGHSIRLNNEAYTVVGVMPEGFSPDGYAELWMPSRWGVPSHPLEPAADPRPFRDRNYLDVYARLKPGVTLAQARANMDGIAAQLEKQYPDANDDVGVSLIPMQESLVGNVRTTLYVLLGAVGFVLLISCANVANLLLARGNARAKEISVRQALGAGPGRLIRLVLSESMILAVSGGLLGVLLATFAVPLLMTMAPRDISEFAHKAVNPQVLAFSLLLSVFTGLLFGLVPALQASGSRFLRSLRESERGTTAHRSTARSALVVLEMGLSLVLLIGAGLMLKSFVRLLRVDPGFEAGGLLVFNVGLPPTTSPERQDDFYREVTDRLRAIPGVKSAAAVSRLPLSGGNSSRSFTLPGSKQDFEGDFRVSTPDYFSTMGIPLLRGRVFTPHDNAQSSQVVVINQALAERTFPGEDPLGRYLIHFGPNDAKLQIVGVVGNVRHSSLEEKPRPEVYLPFGQGHWPSVFMVVRSQAADASTLIASAQTAVWSVDRSVALADVRTMNQVIARSVVRRKFTMSLLSIFAGLALALAAVGLYGVMAYSISQRTHEIGIRMALGARRADVLKMVIKQGMAMAGAGVVLGIVAALALTRLMSGLLFGVTASDPLTFLILASLLAVVALFANYIPARRATKVDPMVALRYE